MPGRMSAVDQVVQSLRQSIATLEMRPGQTLDKTALAARFGVSRFPISEALNRLQAEGLVDIRPQIGSRVSLIRLAHVEENLFMRRALEAEMAEALAQRRDRALLDELRRNLRYQRAAVDADDREGFHSLDLDFHDAMADRLAYPRLRAMLESLRLSLDRARRLIGSPRRHAITHAEHVAIVAALEIGDARAARAAMAGHIDAVMTELQDFSERHPEVFADMEAASDGAVPAHPRTDDR